MCVNWTLSEVDESVLLMHVVCVLSVDTVISRRLRLTLTTSVMPLRWSSTALSCRTPRSLSVSHTVVHIILCLTLATSSSSI